MAQAHSQDMADRGYFSHTNPEGQSPFDRLRAAGIDFSSAGENIASGPTTAQAVFDLWMGSSGHRANIERCAYTHHGVGLSSRLWTHLFLTDPS